MAIRNYVPTQDYDKLRLACLRSGKRFSDPLFTMYNEAEGEYASPGHLSHPRAPLFINGTPSRFDALQGAGGDCWVIAAMELLTFHHEIFNHVVPPNQNFTNNYCGIFHFRIWQLGTWYDVVVDDNLPVFKDDLHKLMYCHSQSGHVFWAVLLEKAYAKVVSLRNNLECTYDWIFKNNNPLNSMQDFTGGMVESIPTAQNPSNTQWWHFFTEAKAQKALMCCHIWDKKGAENLNLLSHHTYAITDVFKASEYDKDGYPGLYIIRVMNPWGAEEWKGWFSDDDETRWKQFDAWMKNKLDYKRLNDGEFWMDEHDFLKYFETVFICHLGAYGYLLSHKCHEPNMLWNWLSYRGEWIKNVSSGGKDPSTRHQNPQYFLDIDEYHKENQYSVIIELVQHFKITLTTKPYINVMVFPVPKGSRFKLPLNSTELYTLKPFTNEYDLQRGGRSVLIPLDLQIGRYLLLPVTFERNDEAQFLLRVYTHRNNSISGDGKISKSSTAEETIRDEFDESVKKLFDDVARGQDEIDWIGLKKILDTTMNQEGYDRRSELNMVESCFNFICDVFKNYFPNLSNDYETDDVTFTKNECRRMIAMLDENHSGELSLSEFCNLWNKIKFWTKVYEQYRDETEGFVTISQLQDALSSIGYNINKRTIHSLSYIYMNEQGHIILTDFILCGIALETALTLCQKAGIEDKKEITFKLEDWVKSTLNL